MGGLIDDYRSRNETEEMQSEAVSGLYFVRLTLDLCDRWHIFGTGCRALMKSNAAACNRRRFRFFFKSAIPITAHSSLRSSKRQVTSPLIKHTFATPVNCGGRTRAAKFAAKAYVIMYVNNNKLKSFDFRIVFLKFSSLPGGEIQRQ